jgi:hypothetical protein
MEVKVRIFQTSALHAGKQTVSHSSILPLEKMTLVRNGQEATWAQVSWDIVIKKTISLGARLKGQLPNMQPAVTAQNDSNL